MTTTKLTAALTALTLSVALTSCGEDGGSTPAPPADDGPAQDVRQALLRDVGHEVIAPTYVDFRVRAGALQEATSAWVASGAVSDRQAAQAAWREAMATWQRAELFQVGPAGVMGDVVGGEDLRDEIYSWPLVNPCRVDQEIVEAAYEDADAFKSEPINVRGLDAMEYLLFAEGADNACTPNSRINTDGSWAALGDDEVKARRAAYADTLAQLLVQSAGQLEGAWTQEGAFVEAFATAGDGGTAYASRREALNNLSDALFYLDKETKDMKLAEPAGLTACDTMTCPEALESKHAMVNKQHILNNLQGFSDVYHGGEPGGEGVGFDELLRAVGAEELADDMTDRIAAAITAIDAVPGDLHEALDGNLEEVVAAHEALRELTTLLKTQFIGVLDLELPQRAEGDND